MENRKSGKKVIGIAMAAIMLASIFAIIAPASVADHPHEIPSGETTIIYFHPDNTSSPDCSDKTVKVYVNTTAGIAGGQLAIQYNKSCVNVTNWVRNTALWDMPTGAGWDPFDGGIWITFSNGSAIDHTGDLLIGYLTIECNVTCPSECCASNMLFGMRPGVGPTELYNASSGKLPFVSDNGTFICGKPLIINKTVRDPATGNWVDGPLTLGPEWKDKDLVFNITVTALCENLSNVVVNDTMDPSLKYNGSASVDPDSYTNHTVNWTIGSLSAGSSWTVTFNATIVAYGTDNNTASASGTVDKIGGVGVADEDTVTETTNPPALIDVNKTVWSKPKGDPDYNNGTWVNVAQGAKIGEIYRFNCTIHNSGSYDLTNITFNDTLSNSLEYAGNATMVTPDGIKRNITMSGDGKDYEVNSFLQSPLTLKPSQRIYIEFDARVINYGNDSNVQWAKGQEPSGIWIYDHDDAWINTTKPDLNVSEITINYEATKPQVRNNAIGPLPPGTKTQCNNLSAVIEEDNGVDVVFPFNVTFKANGNILCTKRIPGLPGHGSQTVYCNCSFYPIAGERYNISVNVDSDDEIIESDETNNTKWRNVTAKWLGLKGDGWQDGRNITKLQCHEQGTINITYSAGDSKYLSGSSHWTSYTVNWTASDLPIPPTDTCIKKARLYVYYTWDITPGRNISDYFVMKFNGYEVQKDKVYTDARQAGDYINYGMVAYNVTDVFSIGGNTANLINTYPGGGNVSMEGMFLVVVYNNTNETERIIMMNEGLDWIKADDAYCVSTEEATTYATFTCPAIPLSRIGKATLATVTVDAGSYGTPADPHWQALYFNGVLLGKGKEIWPVKYSIPTVNETDVLPYLKATNNTAAIQSYKPPGATYGDSFEASLAFLILEKAPKEIYVEPEETVVQPQDQFDVHIKVNPHGLDVYAVQYTLKYDPSVLKAESQVKGDFFGDNDTIVVVNEIDQANGIIKYAETLKGDKCIHDDGTVATIEFTAIGEPGSSSSLNLSDVILVDCDKKENMNVNVSNGSVQIFNNTPPVIVHAGSKHEMNNAQKKFECWTTLCVNVTDNDTLKGYNISYIRWSFGDGQYGTAEGGLPCNGHNGCCICKNHSYISWKYNATGRMMPSGHVVKYDPFNASVTVTDDGFPPKTDTEFFDVWVFMTGDANGDGVVNILDAVWVGKHFGESCDGAGTCCGYMWSSNEQSGADLNNDCKINILDAVIVGTMWGHTAY